MRPIIATVLSLSFLFAALCVAPPAAAQPALDPILDMLDLPNGHGGVEEEDRTWEYGSLVGLGAYALWSAGVDLHPITEDPDDVEVVDMGDGERVANGALGVTLAVAGGILGVVALTATAPAWLAVGGFLAGAAIINTGLHFGFKAYHGKKRELVDDAGDNSDRNDPVEIELEGDLPNLRPNPRRNTQLAPNRGG